MGFEQSLIFFSDRETNVCVQFLEASLMKRCDTVTRYLTNMSMSLNYMSLLIQKCMKLKSHSLAKQVHAFLLTRFPDLNILSFDSKLVGLYASCSDIHSAKFVFDSIPKPNVFSLNWMVSGNAFNGNYSDAIGYFSMMQSLGVFCNKYTLFSVLKACLGLMDVNKGKEVHCMVFRMCFYDDVIVSNGLIDMYSKCRKLGCARKVFEGLLERDIASWTSMICGYINVGRMEEALLLFERMKEEGLEPNEFTWNAMIAGYARHGDGQAAMGIFNRMRREGVIADLVTWNALISGFVQSQQAREAVQVFQELLFSGVKPNHVTITGFLPVCGMMGLIQLGKETHGFIYRMELFKNVFVTSVLIDMYSKCGSVKDALNVFDAIPVKNVASWNAMIGCYGKHGMVYRAIELFERLKEEDLQANEVTLTCILSACSHAGLVEKGLEIFRSIEEDHKIKLQKEHYACLLDLLCRSGWMVEAYELVKKMLTDVNESNLGAFFNGCAIHRRRDLAELINEDIMAIKVKKPGTFVTLSNIYAQYGSWEGVQNVRKVMQEKRICKTAGCSWVEKWDESAISAQRQ